MRLGLRRLYANPQKMQTLLEPRLCRFPWKQAQSSLHRSKQRYLDTSKRITACVMSSSQVYLSSIQGTQVVWFILRPEGFSNNYHV